MNSGNLLLALAVEQAHTAFPETQKSLPLLPLLLS